MAKFIPETEATQPDLDLVEPGCAGSRRMEVHVWMALQPAVILRLVRVEIVEDEEIALRLLGAEVAASHGAEEG